MSTPKPTKESKLSGEGKKYKLMVQVLCSDPRYSKALSEVTKASVHEKLSSCLINFSYETGGALSIIRSLIDLEFDRKHKTKQVNTILRQNSIVSKMMGKFTSLFFF